MGKLCKFRVYSILNQMLMRGDKFLKLLRRLKTRGVKIPSNKERTDYQSIKLLKSPKYLYYPMEMHIGAPAEIKVKPGDYVKCGSLLGERDGPVSANIHSSVSGKVVEIKEDYPSFRGESKTIVVENDGKYEEDLLEEIDEELTPEIISKRIQEAGITGKGGAGFPTHIKFDSDEEGLNYLIVNAAECEPYSTTDNRVAIEFASEIIQMIDALHKAYHLKSSIIAIEDEQIQAIEVLKRVKEENGADYIKIAELPTIYPQGHGALQIKTILDLEVAEHENSDDVGVLQSNVSTIKAMYDAVFENRPFTHRVVTVTGPKINNANNFMIPIGRPVEYIIEKSGGLRDANVKMIDGGPMMGLPFDDIRIPVAKDTTTLLFFPHDEKIERQDCIRCSRCVESCPVALQPILISNAWERNRLDLAKDLQAEVCIQCGLCTYICPAKIPLLANIRDAIQAIEEEKEDD